MFSLNEEQMNQSEIDWLVANKDQVDFNGTLRSLIWEQKFAHLLGAKFVDRPGYDLLHPVLKRVEVKCSFSWHVINETVAFGGLKSKKGKCDNFLFYSGVLNQVVLIKHDDLFKEGVLYEDPNGSLHFRVKVKELKNNMAKKSPAIRARELWLDNLIPFV